LSNLKDRTSSNNIENNSFFKKLKLSKTTEALDQGKQFSVKMIHALTEKKVKLK